MIKKKLTNFKHSKIISFHEVGDFEKKIMKKTDYEKTIIYNIIVKYYEKNITSIVFKSECSKKLSEHNKCHLKVIINKNCCDFAKKLIKNFSNLLKTK